MGKNNEYTSKGRFAPLIFNISCVILAVYLGYGSIDELFLRAGSFVSIKPGAWDRLHVDFYISTPTVSWFVILIGSVFSLYYSGVLLWIGLKGNNQTARRKYRIFQIVALVTMIIAGFIALADFMNRAGSFG